MGNRTAYLQQAAKIIDVRCGSIIAASHIYETAAWGLTEQPAFYNQAFALHTALAPARLMQELLNIETGMGRERTQKMGPRTIDLDILLIDGLVMDTDLLQVPHPHLAARRFALVPLAQIAAQLVHPVLNKSIATLLLECTDTLPVKRIDA